MNILYFLNFYPTKHKIVAHDEMLEMTRRGHRITVVAVWGGEKSEIKDLPFKVYYLKNKIFISRLLSLMVRYRKKYFQHFCLLKKYLGFQDALKYLSSYHIILKNKVDRIHAHFANNAALKAYLLSKFINVPFSCTGHGSELLLYPEPYLKELIANARPFVTISNYNKKYLEDKYDIAPDVIKVNYAGIYLDKFFPIPNYKKNPLFTIISVTGLIKIKGVNFLIDACKLIQDEGLDFQCNIVGTGELYDDLLSQIMELELQNSVFLLGKIENNLLVRYYNESDLFVLPSLSESMGVVNMEALACELPVIATNVRGVNEIIIDGYTGYLVPPANSIAIADKIEFCYHNPDIVKELGRNGRMHVIKTFDIVKNVQRFEDLLKHYD